jgi:hypothetical protein
MKTLQYKLSACGMQQQKVIPIVIETAGTLSKLFRTYLNNIPGRYEFKELQKISILGTAHTVQTVLI